MEHTKISEHFDILTWIPNINIVNTRSMLKQNAIVQRLKNKTQSWKGQDRK